jgi:hypothetical protein
VPGGSAAAVFSRGRLGVMRPLAETDPESQGGKDFTPTRDPSPGCKRPESQSGNRFFLTTRWAESDAALTFGGNRVRLSTRPGDAAGDPERGGTLGAGISRRD